MAYDSHNIDTFEYGNDYLSKVNSEKAVGLVINLDDYTYAFVSKGDVGFDEYDYDYQECEALVLNGEKKNMKEEELVEMTKEPRIAIIILNINPNSLTQESESELRYWIEESKRVLYDTEMPDDIKIKSLPFIDFNMETEGGTKVKLNECKFVKDYTTKEYKYYFAVLVYGVNEI